MKIFITKNNLFLFLTVLISVTAPTYCFANDYQDSCNPLMCGAFDIQAQGGINPIIWRNRGEFDTVNCVGFINPLIKIFDTPKFHTFFHIPWIVGGQVGYAYSDNTRVYLEFNYCQASAKDAIAILTANPLVIPPQTVAFSIKNYRLYDFYFGTRYYFDRWCERVSLFLGAKVGLTHHKSVALNTLTISAPQLAPINIISPSTLLFKNNTSISGGFNAGFDCCFCDNWALVITGEIVASCGPKSNHNIVLAPSVMGIITATNIIVGQIQTELRFPITAGIRFSF